MTAEADQVADLADRFWQEHLVADPVSATIHGDRRYDDRLDDPTPEGRAARLASLRATRRDVEALDATALDAETRITRDALLTELDGEAAAIEADLGAWTLDPSTARRSRRSSSSRSSRSGPPPTWRRW